MHQGVIPWGNIAKLKERSIRQYLDLFDSHDNRVLRIDYRLDGFEQLRDIIVDKIIRQKLEYAQSSFARGSLYHAGFLVVTLCLFVLGLYVGKNLNPVIGYGILSTVIVFIGLLYFNAAVKINLTKDSVELAYLRSERSIHFNEITAVLLTDVIHRKRRTSRVSIRVYNSKTPTNLPRIGVGATTFYIILQTAIKKHRRQYDCVSSSDPRNYYP